MRIRMLVATCMLLTLGAVAQGAPEDEESLRDPRNILFEGVQSFDVSQLQKRLALDIDVQVAGHPKNPLPDFLKTLEDALVAGYRNSGFPNARAAARFDSKRQRVVARVDEGPRYRCFQVRVSGLAADESSALIAYLTTDAQSVHSIPASGKAPRRPAMFRDTRIERTSGSQ